MPESLNSNVSQTVGTVELLSVVFDENFCDVRSDIVSRGSCAASRLLERKRKSAKVSLRVRVHCTMPPLVESYTLDVITRAVC